jgi:hypothetical protein
MREVTMTNIGALNIEKLDVDIRAAVVTFAGLRRGKDRSVLTLLFADKASDEDIATAQGMVRAHDPTSKTPEQQVLANLRETAASAAGVALADLTAGQRNALIAVLLWKAGAIDKDGTIRPLADWVR